MTGYVLDDLALTAGFGIRSINDLTADTFGSDEELDEFLVFIDSERRRDVVPRVIGSPSSAPRATGRTASG